MNRYEITLVDARGGPLPTSVLELRFSVADLVADHDVSATVELAGLGSPIRVSAEDGPYGTTGDQDLDLELTRLARQEIVRASIPRLLGGDR